MDDRFVKLAALAASRHGVFTPEMARLAGISDQVRHQWHRAGRVARIGNRSARFAGSPPTWKMRVVAALDDLGPGSAASGRTDAALHGLDGFTEGPVEIWVPRSSRNRSTLAVAHSSQRPLLRGDVRTIDGIRCVSVERMILDSLLFGFSATEIENAINSAIRLRWVSERRLITRIRAELPVNSPGRRALVGALVDLGGESRLERRFLALVRQAGLARPAVQRTYRDGGRVIARVDAEFDGGLVVELDGHATHSGRRQRQRDAQRRTELTNRGKRVLTFTTEDVEERPDWAVAALRSALQRPVA
jgi:very-short-patch-repair endonuclease